MYVPLSENQKQAENVIELDHDIFLKEVETPEEAADRIIKEKEELVIKEQKANSELSLQEQLELIKNSDIGDEY